MEATKIALFKGKKIRKTIHNNEWWFVIVDVVAALTDSLQPDGYLKDMRRRDPELSKGWGQIATPLLIKTEGGQQKINCANMLGERSTTEIHRTEDSQGLNKLKSDANAGGDIAGNARKQLEKRLGRSVITKNNFLKQPSKAKKLPEK